MTVTKVSARDPPTLAAPGLSSGGAAGVGVWEGALLLGTCSLHFLCSPSRSTRSGPQGLQREGGGCRFGSHCGLDNIPPHRPNPRTAFLTLV